MDFKGILYRDKNSYDNFGIIIKSRSTTSPSKHKYLIELPYKNGSIDFSSMYDNASYDDRDLTYEFDISANTQDEIMLTRRNLENWLSRGNERTELYDDLYEDYHFIAECTTTKFEQKGLVATFTATFTANPFMISKDFGETIWDNIIFDTDNINLIDYPSANTAQGATYEVYNFSKNSITPKFTVTGTTTAGLNCYLNSIQHVFTSDVTDVEVDGFTLKSGKNILHLQGVGTLAISMIEEVL